MAELTISTVDLGLGETSARVSVSACDAEGNRVEAHTATDVIVRTIEVVTGVLGVAVIDLPASAELFDEAGNAPVFFKATVGNYSRVFVKASGPENLLDTSEPTPVDPGTPALATTNLADWSPDPADLGDVPIWDGTRWDPGPLPESAAAVTSVNGQTDVVVLDAADVGADAAGAAVFVTAVHSADTTDVHGIADTADLVTSADLDDLVTVTELADALAGQPGGLVETVTGTAPVVVDNTDPANPVVAITPGTFEATGTVAAEAALARNADNLTSGTVADARVAATIARDAEVTAAVAAEATLARNADNLTSGTVADARIASTIARDAEVTAAIAAAMASATARDPLFGTGADGSTTVSGTTTLTRDMQYEDLTVTGTLVCNNWRVMVRGALAGNGVIHSDGASNAGTGAPGVPVTGWYEAGQRGGAGGTAAGSAGTAHAANNHVVGATGGAGGTGSSGAGGAAGTMSTIATAFAFGVTTVDLAKASPLMVWIGRLLAVGSTSNKAVAGGGAGGGGGGDGTAGGGGANGGGICGVFARDASAFTGAIRANGGSGFAPVAGNRGGGGGGGGGLAALLARILPTGAYTITATGGTGGAGFGTGTAGTNGTDGTTIARAI